MCGGQEIRLMFTQIVNRMEFDVVDPEQILSGI